MISAVNRRLPLNGNKDVFTGIDIFEYKVNLMYSYHGFFLFLILVASAFKPALAQNDSTKKDPLPVYRIGIFSPLYLDSVFNRNTYRYSKSIPRFIVPALEFVQGAEIAMDSLPASNEHTMATIYDTRSYNEPVSWLIQNNKLDSLQMMIGNVRDPEYRQLADFALKKKIPFISATYPNDGGVINNPYLVIVNSTLKTHCEAIYSYLLQNHGTDKIFLCRQKGTKEDLIVSYLQESNIQDGRVLLDMQVLNLEAPYPSDSLKARLDSNRQNIIIGCSLDEDFAAGLTMACFKLLKPYPIKLFGMPNWDGMSAFHKKGAFTDFPIYLTSPYYNNKLNTGSRIVVNAYNKKYKGKPTDMAFKGYEAVSFFLQLLKKYPADPFSQLNNRSIATICEYNFRPVMVKKENTATDYFENRHVYFIKLLNGAQSKAW